MKFFFGSFVLSIWNFVIKLADHELYMKQSTQFWDADILYLKAALLFVNKNYITFAVLILYSYIMAWSLLEFAMLTYNTLALL